MFRYEKRINSDSTLFVRFVLSTKSVHHVFQV